MTVIKTDFGSGGANLNPGGSGGAPDLATTLRDIADDLEAAMGAVAPDWDTGITVTSDTVTLATAGFVIAVEATTASVTGPKSMIQSGSPATLQVDVSYDANGVPTLLFNSGTDSVTACAVKQLKRGSGVTGGRKTIKG